MLRANQYATVPWRNGGGTTQEIAAWYDPVQHDDFMWRLSIATVEESGPFSQFEGIDRTIAHLNGKDMLLRSADTSTQLTGDSPPFSFCGEMDIFCELDGGPTSDLNAMTRRGFFSHTMRRETFMGWKVVEGTAHETILVSNAFLELSYRGRGNLQPLDTIVGIFCGMAIELYSESPAEIFVVQLTAL